MVRWKGSLQV